MAGGDKNIKPSDNPKPFKEGNKAAEKWTESDALTLGKDLIDWMNKDENNYLYEKFLVKKGLYTSVIAYLSKKYTTFSNLIEEAANIQKIKLIEKGLERHHDSTLTKFLLMNNHGMLDKPKQEEQTEDKGITIHKHYHGNGKE